MVSIIPPLTLADLHVGDEATVIGYSVGDPGYRMKLLALGLTRNTPFKIVKAAPMGDPVEIELRGYRLSLRKLEATSIQVQRTHEEPCDRHRG